MNMKKFFSLLMAALMMASVLAGCGGTEEAPAEDTQTPAEDTQTPAEGEATGTGTELKFSAGVWVLTMVSAACWLRPLPPAAPAPR